jgi:hypothetical protein
LSQRVSWVIKLLLPHLDLQDEHHVARYVMLPHFGAHILLFFAGKKGSFFKQEGLQGDHVLDPEEQHQVQNLTR